MEKVGMSQPYGSQSRTNARHGMRSENRLMLSWVTLLVDFVYVLGRDVFRYRRI